MPFNGSGAFTRVHNWQDDADAAIDIVPDRHDAEDNGFATGLSNCITKDGQTTITANIPFATFKITGLGAGTAATDAANLSQVQKGTSNWVASGGTADAITATYSPAVTALVDGMELNFRATGANTITNPTFSPNGLTARTITQKGGSALAAGSISGALFEAQLRYNLANTRWELLNPASMADPGSNGIVARTAFNTTTARTITAGANISVTNGNGVSGNPAIGFSGTLPVANGGTGATSLTANNVVLGNGTSAVQVVAPGSSGNVLTSNGTTWTSAAAPNLVKAWAYFNGTTLIAGTAGVSISKASTGNYIVTIPAQPNANYAKLVMGGGSADVTCWAVDFSTAAVYTAPTTTSFYFSSKDAGNTARDFDYCSIIIVGT